METAALTLILVLLVVFASLQFKIFKPKYPYESEVLGKDLPVGFRFMKNGKVVITNGKCDKCAYNNKCIGFKSPECTPNKRKDGEWVAFKEVKQELEKL